MKNALRSLTAVAIGLAVFAASPAAHATLLPPDSTIVPSPQLNPLTGTTMMGTTGAQPFNVSQNGASMTGTAQEWVVSNFTANPFGLNDLTFVIQVSLTGGTSTSGSSAIIQRIADSGFGISPITDAGYNATGAQVIPTTADRSPDGDIVAFSYLPHAGLAPSTNIGVGQSSALLIINTNATQYTLSNLSVQGTVAANVLGFAPVPEPSMLALSAAGLGGIMLRRRRTSSAA